MKVIFTTDVKGVARKGEQKEVSEGYYRNLLAAKGYAVPVTDPKAKQILGELQKKLQAQQADTDKVRQMANDLNGKTITLTAKAQSNGKLFGAIREADVAAQLGIDKKHIGMDPIKTAGTHVVKLRFAAIATATVTVVVNPIA